MSDGRATKPCPPLATPVIKWQFLLVKSYEKVVNFWVKSKNFEICTPFSGVGDPSVVLFAAHW